MKALYSLVCRLRTVCALARGTATLVFEGWAALAPAQVLLLGCGFCLLLRVAVPSPTKAGARAAVFLDHVLSVSAAGSVAALIAGGIVGSCAALGRLAARL